MVSSSKGEQPVDEEPRTGKFQYDLAFYSLNMAEDYLKGLINRKYTGPHNTYASNIDSGTRFIHLGVWHELPRYKTVRENYIPLLEKARDSIDINDFREIKRHNPRTIKNNADYPAFAMHVMACIDYRIKNLRRYCRGLNSDAGGCQKKVEKEGKYKFID